MKTKWFIPVLFFSLILSGCKKAESSDGTLGESTPSVTSEVITSETPSIVESTYPVVTFRVTSPIEVPANAKIKIAGGQVSSGDHPLNGWNPLAEGYALSHVSGNVYSLELTFTAEDIGKRVNYKYVLVYDDQTEGPWNNVEGDASGGEIGNRTITLKAEIYTVNDTIRSFKNNMSSTSLTRGTLEKVVLEMPQFSDGRKRTIRIWLPEGYDPSDTAKKYPVMYMHDGQNLFDSFTAFSGEWQIDEAIGKMMDEGYSGTIVVGIDNGGSERLNEYSPNWPLDPESEASATNAGLNNAAGEKYAAFVVETLKPYIDTKFNTLSDKANTGIGGSSMGGIISFYTALKYQDIFGYALIFSSSFWLYQSNVITNFINEQVTDASKVSKMYLYHGTAEGSYVYLDTIISALLEKGMDSALLRKHVGEGRAHNEPSWALEFPAGYRYLVGI